MTKGIKERKIDQIQRQSFVPMIIKAYPMRLVEDKIASDIHKYKQIFYVNCATVTSGLLGCIKELIANTIKYALY